MAFKLIIVFAIFYGDMTSSLADEEIVCKGNTPIKCPGTGVCCEVDQFCHTGLCHPCLPDGMSREKLLVKCRTMTTIQLIEEFNLQCQDMCQRIFTFEDLNKNLLDEMADHLQINYINHTKFIGEINYLKQREDKIYQMLNQIMERRTVCASELKYLEVVEVQQKESRSTTGDAVKHSRTAVALSCCALFLALVLIIIIVQMWKRIIKLEEKHPQGVENQDENLQLLPVSVNERITDTVKQKLTLALNPVKLSIQNLETNIKNENIAALREEIDKVQSENFKLKTSHNEQLTSSTKLEKEIADLKKENTTLKAALAEQAATGITLNNSLKEIPEMKQENNQLRLSLEKQEVKVMTMERELNDLKVKGPPVNNLFDNQLENVQKELRKLNSKVKLLSENLNKTETFTEEASSDGDKPGEERSIQERAPNRQMASNQGFDSFATTLEKPKAFGVKAHNGLSLSSEDEKWVHTSLTEEES